MVADEVKSNPESRQSLEDKSRSCLFVDSFDQFDRVHDECTKATNGGTKPEYFSSQSHTDPHCICLLYLDKHVVSEVGLIFIVLSIDGRQVFGEILN